MDYIQRSFTGGELAPSLRTRADLVKYASGLARCENFIIRPQGGVYNRAGFEYIEQTVENRITRLIPFQLSADQSYILVFTKAALAGTVFDLRFIKDGAYIETSPGVPYVIFGTFTSPATPSSSLLFEMQYTQDGDSMILVAKDTKPRKLTRITDTNWTWSVIDFSPTVGAPINLLLTAIGTGGGTFNKTYTYVVSAVNSAGVESLISLPASATTASLSQTYGIEIDWDVVADAAYYRVYKDVAEISGVYGWIGDSKTNQFRDFNIAPDYNDAPLVDSDALTASNNYPAVVSYYQQRLFFARTNNEPETVFSTRTGEGNSLRKSIPSRADDALTFSINGRQINEIRHIVSIDSMIILTSGGEWLVTEGQDQVLTPSTLGVRPQGYNGASKTRPAALPSSFMYVQNKGTKIRNLSYSATNLSYGDSDVSLVSEHLFDGYEIIEMQFAAEPYGIVWCLRNDGVLLGLTHQPEQQISAWHKHSTDGVIESIAVISEGDSDVLYAVIARTINEVPVRYIERMGKRIQSSPEDAVYLDACTIIDGSLTNIVSGLIHLANTEVTAVLDGNVVTGLTVTAGGLLSLPDEANKIVVGLPYVSTLDTLDIDTGNTKGHQVNVSKVKLVLEKSRGGFVGPLLDDDTTGEMFEIKPRFDSDGYDTIQLKSQQFDVNISKQWRRGGGIRVEQNTPMPMGILAVIPDVDVSS